MVFAYCWDSGCRAVDIIGVELPRGCVDRVAFSSLSQFTISSEPINSHFPLSQSIHNFLWDKLFASTIRLFWGRAGAFGRMFEAPRILQDWRMKAALV